MFKSGFVRAKPRIGGPGVIYEKDADRAAKQMMQIPDPQVQRQTEEKEELQRKAEPAVLQRQETEEEVLQGKFNPSEASAQLEGDGGEAENRNGMPHSLKAGLEAPSGMDLSGARVHYNASKPAQLNALAYTQGHDIHVGPGQEKHLPHEGWHAVQQRQERVKPTIQAKGVSINDDPRLEREADVMGAKASEMTRPEQATTRLVQQRSMILQREVETRGESEASREAIGMSMQKVRLNFLSTSPSPRVQRAKIIQRQRTMTDEEIAAKLDAINAQLDVTDVTDPMWRDLVEDKSRLLEILHPSVSAVKQFQALEDANEFENYIINHYVDIIIGYQKSGVTYACNLLRENDEVGGDALMHAAKLIISVAAAYIGKATAAGAVASALIAGAKYVAKEMVGSGFKSGKTYKVSGFQLKMENFFTASKSAAIEVLHDQLQQAKDRLDRVGIANDWKDKKKNKVKAIQAATIDFTLDAWFNALNASVHGTGGSLQQGKGSPKYSRTGRLHIKISDRDVKGLKGFDPRKITIRTAIFEGVPNDAILDRYAGRRLESIRIFKQIAFDDVGGASFIVSPTGKIDVIGPGANDIGLAISHGPYKRYSGDYHRKALRIANKIWNRLKRRTLNNFGVTTVGEGQYGSDRQRFKRED